ncbi:MAG: histidine--tRNA ligase [bacterium]|nr:histidine--tRNA ligase [bacterium]
MKANRTVPRLYKGFRDIFAADLQMRNWMIDRIRTVYERYGFAPLETPAIEYVDVLGKFLPEADQPDGGIFSFRNEDQDWIALRYDLTAPLSRVVAQYPELPRPFRRYQVGPVYRFEKPGPGRFREFYQFDFDTVGASSMMADAEVCMIIAETLEALGIERGQYLVKVNDRKILSGVLESAGLLEYTKDVTYKGSNGEEVTKTITAADILRSIDKLDKIGIPGVKQLLSGGRRDQSGDFTPGCQLSDEAIAVIEAYLNTQGATRLAVCDQWEKIVGESKIGLEGVAELREIDGILSALGIDESQVIYDPTIVRGLAYYTGPVFEAVLTFPIFDEKGEEKQFGTVFGGGRYDSLIERFTGQKVAATGASVGVDRLLAALKLLGKVPNRSSTAQVLVTVMDKKSGAEYAKIAKELREAGINAELFTGNGNIGKQLKYADHCNIPFALIAGENEFAAGEVQIKDLWLGKELSEQIAGREEWRRDRPAQSTVKREELVAFLKEALQ